MATQRLPLPSVPPQLVGRARDQAVLREVLAGALAGQGALVLLGGEAGIGKTALAESLCQEAAGQDALVLVGRCYDLTETPPYGPFIDLLRGYQPTDGLPPAPFAGWPGANAAGSRAALYERFLEFFRAVSARRPLLLLLDDLHWADHASLDLLRVVARALPAWSALVLATYRADELSRRHPLQTLMPLLERESPVVRIAVPPLDHDAVGALVVSRYHLAADETARLTTYLGARAEGNALFVVQLLRALEEHGILRPVDQGWTLGELLELGVPGPLVQVIDARLARLDETTRDLLSVAAVIGQDVRLRLWAAAAAVDEATVTSAAEAASAMGLVDPSADGTRVRFVHALIREAIYAGAFPPRRRTLHRQVAEVLATVPAADPDETAHHFVQAGDARAFPWLVRAGERARRAYAHHAAVDRLERALALADEAGLGGDADRAVLLIRLGIAHRFVRHERGLTCLEQAADLLAQGDNPALAATCQFHLGHTRAFGPDVRRGIAEMEAGIAALARLPAAAPVLALTGTDLALARGVLVLYRALVGRFAEASTLAEADAVGDGRGGAGFLGTMYAHAALGRPAAALADFARAAARHRADRHFRQLGVDCAFCLLSVVLPYYAADPATGDHIAAEGALAWKRESDTESEVPAPMLSALPVLFRTGRWGEITASESRWNLSNSSYQALALTVLGPLARERGDTAAAWHYVRAILPHGPPTEPGDAIFFAAQQMQRLAAALALDAGDLAAARTWLTAHDRWLAWSGATLNRAEGALLWSQYHHASGDVGLASEQARQALAYASDPPQPLALLAARRALGALAVETGDGTEGEAHLQAALALANVCAAPYERALTLLALAELWRATGALAAARQCGEEARAICLALDARPALARAEAALAALPTRTRVPAYSARLSAREAAVLRLVAAGHTNREIASRLCLGERTVQTHVRSILTKTATANRTAAAAFARDHGLA